MAMGKELLKLYYTDKYFDQRKND